MAAGLLQGYDATVRSLQSACACSKAALPHEEIRLTTQCHHIWILQQSCS